MLGECNKLHSPTESKGNKEAPLADPILEVMYCAYCVVEFVNLVLFILPQKYNTGSDGWLAIGLIAQRFAFPSVVCCLIVYLRFTLLC